MLHFGIINEAVSRPVARINFGGVQDPKSGPFEPPNVDLLNLTP